MFQISEVQESPAFNGGRSFLTLRLERARMALPTELKPLFGSIEELSAAAVRSEEDEELYDRLRDEADSLSAEFSRLFEHCWKAESTAVSAEDWRIENEFAPSWSGTAFWASNIDECAAGIRRRINNYLTQIETTFGSAGIKD
jgi:hypothetical protein